MLAKFIGGPLGENCRCSSQPLKGYSQMRLNIKEFLKYNGVHYREHGTGVKKGNIVVKCPYCGDADKGEHLGIKLKTGQWGCWRDAAHRGNDLAKLLSKLTGIGYAQLKALIGNNGEGVVERDLFDAIVCDDYFQSSAVVKTTRIKTLIMPREFRRIGEYKNSAAENRFLLYMEHERHFSHIKNVFNYYDLRYALTGKFKNRIIMPIILQGQLVTWTSRSIQKNSALRYMSLLEECSSVNIKSVLYNFDNAYNRENARTLFVVEGPMDVLKLDNYARTFGDAAVGLFSMIISDDQLFWIEFLSKRYKKVVLLLDVGETNSTMHGLVKMESVGIDVVEGTLPSGVDDPGKLNKDQIEFLCDKWGK